MMRRSAGSDGIISRMVRIPRNILVGFARIVDQSIDLIATGGRRNHHLTPNFQYHHPQQPLIQEEYALLDSFERQYGSVHPFFYACRFAHALRMAGDENKLVFLYLHSPDHPLTLPFCRESLCSELVVEFLDANFVSWGGLACRGEGLHLATTLRASSFPFCAVVAPASGDTMAVLRQIEGPASPAELVDILQRTVEEQGLAFGGSRAKEEEKLRMDRLLREEQDAAYIAALRIDQEKEKQKISHSEPGVSKNVDPSKSRNEMLKQTASVRQHAKAKETNNNKGEMLQKDIAGAGKDAPITQIQIRFPNGERREHTFSCTDKIQGIFRYIDSLNLPGTGNYRLVSNFPRKVYGVDQMGMSLEDAGLYPKASLFIELL